MKDLKKKMSRIENFYENNLGLALARGNDPQYSGEMIEAYNATIGTSKEDLWSQSGLQTWIPTAAALSISSSSASDSDVDVSVEVLLANWTTTIWTINTDGQTQTDIESATPAIRVNRAWVSGATASVGKIYIYEKSEGTVTAGVPQTASKIHAVIEIADQETKHAWWSIPVGYEGYVIDWQVDTLVAVVITNLLEVREFGGVFISKDRLRVNAQSKGKTKVIMIKCPPKSDVKITSVSASGSNLVDGELALALRKL